MGKEKMKMSNSPLVSYTKISPNKTSPRNHKIDTISIHMVVGQLSVETIGNVFAPESRQASSNYGIGFDGRIGLYVDEGDRSWCTSSKSNDHRAITIEVASDRTPPYAVNEKAYASLINLLVDICKRNDIKQLLWKDDKSLIGQVDKQNMTIHRWFSATSCPGDYLYSMHGKIAEEVNTKLGVVNTPNIIQDNDFYDSIKVGDILSFTGSRQYVDSGALNGSIVPKSKVKVTRKYKSTAKHPIHVRSVDDSGNFINGIYGWVNLNDLTPIVAQSFLVRITTDALNYRSGPGVSYKKLGTIRDRGIYTIIEEKNGWGKLKSQVGWISLNYTERI